jgi:hypothetical protein
LSLFSGLACALLAQLPTAPVSQAAEVTLAWEAIRDPDADFYRIYHRIGNDPYDFKTPIWEGTATTCTLTGLADGTSHFFVGRSIDAHGNQSTDSNEIIYIAPGVEPVDPDPSADPDPPFADEDPPPPAATTTRVLFDADLMDLIDNRWAVLDDDPPGAGVFTTYDDLRQSQTTALVGDWINNSFQLTRVDGEALAEGGPWRLVWSMKADLYFFVSVVLLTSAGERTLYYTPSNFDLLGTGPFIHYGLGLVSADGGWYTHARALDDDLMQAQPGVALKEVRAVQIRGQAQVDDIFLEPAP